MLDVRLYGITACFTPESNDCKHKNHDCITENNHHVQRNLAIIAEEHVSYCFYPVIKRKEMCDLFEEAAYEVDGNKNPWEPPRNICQQRTANAAYRSITHQAAGEQTKPYEEQWNNSRHEDCGDNIDWKRKPHNARSKECYCSLNDCHDEHWQRVAQKKIQSSHRRGE